MTPGPSSVLRVSHQLSVPADRAFDAWVDPHVASRWLFATPDGEIVRCDIDARPGGTFVVTDRREGQDVAHLGTYVEVDRPRRLAFRFSVPKYSDVESSVVMTIDPDGDGAQVTIEQRDVPPEWFRQTEEGWRDLLGRLATLLASGDMA